MLAARAQSQESVRSCFGVGNGTKYIFQNFRGDLEYPIQGSENARKYTLVARRIGIAELTDALRVIDATHETDSSDILTPSESGTFFFAHFLIGSRTVH